jgi:hypothetical protein
MGHLSVSSVFYHFIDARRRDPIRMDDFRAWLSGLGSQYDDLCEMLAAVDPFFQSLSELRLQLALIFQSYFGVDGQ